MVIFRKLAKMHDFIYTDLDTISSLIAELSNNKALPALSVFVDGRNLRCPMPLLKTKIALKPLETGTIYVVASDKNSLTDITTFCQKNGLTLESWCSNIEQTDTIFHFLITKNS